MEKHMKNQHNEHISLKGLIELYEGLIKSGRIPANGAGAVRLEQLRNKQFKRKKWLVTPYAKRKWLNAPA
tara:strand:+ start:2532 stop:2741 length:210 start_codon:yes stop_codon:yes gene_type:complete